MNMRAAVVIVEDGKVALIERIRDGHTYFVFPGGGVEAGESTEDAAVREAYEELGVLVELDTLVSATRHGGREHRHYRARIVGGTFGSGQGVEMTTSGTTVKGTYRPVWMAVSGLRKHEVRPPALAETLRSGGLTESGKVSHVENEYGEAMREAEC